MAIIIYGFLETLGVSFVIHVLQHFLRNARVNFHLVICDFDNQIVHLLS